MLNRLFVTALQAKKLSCNEYEASVFEAFLGHNYQKFNQNYASFLQNGRLEELKIGLVEINDSFKDLFAEANPESI